MTAVPHTLDDPAALQAAAEAHLKGRRWAEAAACLQRIARRDVPMQLRLNLATNLAAMQRHRPAVYDVLMSTPAGGEYQVAATPPGKLSVVHRPTGTIMSATNDPPAAAAAQVQRIAASLDDGQAVGLLGLGDGHMLLQLAARAAASDVGMTNAVLVFEPSVDAVMACLMLHDYAGRHGAIEQGRVHWYVGPGWIESYRRAALADLSLPSPQACLSVGPAGKAIHAGVQGVTHELRAHDESLRRQVEAYYAAVSHRELAAVMAMRGDRRPRAMVKTSRFTTVLRYAAADAAAALAQLGWEVRFVMEDHDWQRTSVTALRRHVAEFKPDLVFAIDHLREEFGGLYPPQLPYACWIQDDLPNLTKPEAGRAIGVRDFVLTVSASMYETHYAYPARQCVTMTKLTRPPSRPRLVGAGGPDVVYVSHAAKPTEILVRETIDAFADAPGGGTFVEACARHLVDRYERGGCVHTLGQMDRLVSQLQQDTGTSIVLPQVRDALVRRLMHPLNNALYRRQALRWVLAAAAGSGATVALYGKGWDAHDEFAAHARGPVAYGDDLADLTCRARISLHIVPYFYLHQRLLDGLVAGGFFLVREHPSDTWRLRWKAFVDTHIDPACSTLADARRTLSPSLQAQLDALLAESHDTCLIHGYDNLASYRRLHAEGLDFLYEDLPRRDDVSFADASRCADLLQLYLEDADARGAIAREQRAWVQRHYTYEAGMARAMARIGALIAREEVNA